MQSSAFPGTFKDTSPTSSLIIPQLILGFGGGVMTKLSGDWSVGACVRSDRASFSLTPVWVLAMIDLDSVIL